MMLITSIIDLLMGKIGELRKIAQRFQAVQYE